MRGIRKKKIFSFLMIFIMVSQMFITTYAQNIEAKAKKEDVDKELAEDLEDSDEELEEDSEEVLLPEGPLTIETLYEIAVNNSVQALIDDINILIKEDALNQSKENAAFLGDVYGIQKVLNNRIIKEVKPFEAETNLEVARKTKEDNLNNLKFNVYKTIQSLLIAEKELETEIKRLDILFERYDFLKLKKEQGQVSDSVLVDMEFGIEGKRMDIIRVEEKIETIKTDIKRLLNLPLHVNLPEIVEEIVYEPLVNVSIDRTIKNAFENDTTIFKHNRDIEAIEKTLDLTAQYYPTTNIAYLTPQYTLEQTKAALEEYKLNIEVTIKNSYTNLLNQKDRVILAQKYLEIMRKKLKDAELKYDSGFTTKDVVINAKEALVNAEYQLHSAIYNYIIIKADFNRLAGM
jgi:hypothetical protein